jgi:hypothetical protein
MKIILKADVRKHTTSPQFSTLIVRTFIDDDGKLTELGAQNKATSPSIISRLNEHGGIIPCEWESFREKPAI